MSRRQAGRSIVINWFETVDIYEIEFFSAQQNATRDGTRHASLVI